jgi:cation-transporting P-type ATPase I
MVSPLPDVLALVAGAGRRRRRRSATERTVHLEVRGVHLPRAAALADEVEAVLGELDGVEWAHVNPVLGRAVVRLAEEGVDHRELLEAIEAAERRHGVHLEPFPIERPDHPADTQPIGRHAVALAADVGGLGLAAVGRLARLARLPVPLTAPLPFLQNEPRIRDALAARVGHGPTDVGLAVANAVTAGLTGGPFGLLVSAGYRSLLLREAIAVRAAWEAREDELTDPTRPRHGALEHQRRPKPPLLGPAEFYSRRAGVVGAVAAASVLAGSGDVARASATLVSASPKPARYGPESFAAWMGASLADRGIICLDRRVLRRLDRVDTVCIDAHLLLTGREVLDRVVLSEAADDGARRWFSELFDGAAPQRVRRRGGWRLAPLAKLGACEIPPDLARTVDELEGETLLGLARDGVLHGVATTEVELAPGTHTLVEVARRGDHAVAIAGGSLRLVDQLDAHLLVEGGDALAESIRTLQEDGFHVLLVAGADDAAHRAADVGVGMVLPGEAVPWGADLLCGDDLDDARFVAEAAVVAHEVSRQSAAIALGASSLGGLFVMTRPPWRVTENAQTTIDLGTALAAVNGVRAAVSVTQRAAPEIERGTPWHELPAEEVLDRLETSPAGLGGDEIERRLGLHRDGGPGLASPWQILLEEMANPLTPVLGVGATLSAAVGSVTDAALVVAAVGLNAALGGSQRWQVERAVAELARRQSVDVRVRRAGDVEVVSADELVPGDIVLLEAGDAVPVDARILRAENLEVDESSLTGESLPVPKGPTPSYARAVAERSSMVYDGTSIAAGSAEVVVVAVGSGTEAGAAAQVGGDHRPSGVEARLEQLTRITLPLAVGGGLAVGAAGLLRGRGVRQNIEGAVSLAVAAVPEGLPLLTTMAQLSAARRLADHGALVRNPRAIEALGRVDVLCVDKTGTLTEGRIRLSCVLDCEGTLHEVDGEAAPQLRDIIAAAVRASPEDHPDESLPHLTDRAVVQGAHDASVTTGDGMEGWERVAELPFEPARGYHAVLGTGPERGTLLSVKGAPEVLLPRCDRISTAAGDRPLDGEGRAALAAAVAQVARRGNRVLAVAQRTASDRRDLDDDRIEGLVLLGFVGMSDPVRAEAKRSVERLQAAGVDVVMVTGDHPSTAEGVAAELGILNEHRVMSGAELDRLDDDELAGLVAEVSVFARVTPAHKVRIVAAYQRAGRAVSMTGDGANDAPAIRLADAGVALGAGATAAARTAADVVIPDGRIETLIDAIVEGRAMWTSVRDALAILLGGNLGEIIYTVTGSLVGTRSPLTARQLLLVNLFTDVAPALAIATRPPPDVSPEQLLAEGPDASLGDALNRAIVIRGATTAAGAASAYGLARITGRHRRASTVGLVGLVGTQLGQTLVTGGRHPTVIASSVGAMAALVAVVQTPGVSQFFGCTPLGPVGWAIGGGAAAGATVASVGLAPVVERLFPELGLPNLPELRLPDLMRGLDPQARAEHGSGLVPADAP